MKFVETRTLTIDITHNLLHYLNEHYLDPEDELHENPTELTKDELDFLDSLFEEIGHEFDVAWFATYKRTTKIEE